eukprot:6483493-Prymnesium_polylepis.1
MSAPSLARWAESEERMISVMPLEHTVGAKAAVASICEGRAAWHSIALQLTVAHRAGRRCREHKWPAGLLAAALDWSVRARRRGGSRHDPATGPTIIIMVGITDHDHQRG